MRSRAHRSEQVSSVAGRLVAAAGAIRTDTWVLMGAIVVVSFVGGVVGGLVGLLYAGALWAVSSVLSLLLDGLAMHLTLQADGNRLLHEIAGADEDRRAPATVPPVPPGG